MAKIRSATVSPKRKFEKKKARKTTVSTSRDTVNLFGRFMRSGRTVLDAAEAFNAPRVGAVSSSAIHRIRMTADALASTDLNPIHLEFVRKAKEPSETLGVSLFSLFAGEI